MRIYYPSFFSAYWMQFSMSGDDGTSVITVECATTEIDDQEHSDIDLEKVSDFSIMMNIVT